MNQTIDSTPIDSSPANGAGAPSSPGTPPRIQTSEFRLSPGTHARQAIMRRAARFWMAGALPLLLLLVLGCAYDVRLIFVAAAVLFIIFPTLLLMAWYSLLSRPWAVASLSLQRVTFHPEGDIEVEYLPTDVADIPLRMPDNLFIPAEKVGRAYISGDYIAVSYADNRDLMIPLSAFGSSADVAEVLMRYAPR